MQKHQVGRISQDVVRRTLKVMSKQSVTPRMLRIVFNSDNLQSFKSPSPDDHIKIFVPGDGGVGVVGRNFTPREWDSQTGTFVLDFALHDHGPAVTWARRAQVGDEIEIAGPRGSAVVPDDFNWYLLIGDATALPAIARRLESLRPGAPVRVIALVSDAAEQPYLSSSSSSQELTWINSSGDVMRDGAAILDRLARVSTPTGDGFIWIAAEASLARGVYRHVIEQMGHPREWLKASGYWTFGAGDGGERIS